jgi:hypothetical protein
VRILLGIAALVLVFGLSTLWHRSELRRLHAGSSSGAVHAAPPREHAPGWGEVIVGRPSGAEPVFVEPAAPPLSAARRLRPPGRGAGDSADGEVPAKTLPDGNERKHPRDWELEVRDGDVLSRIVRVHYGRVSPELEQRLAEYNGLSSPDKLRVGQTLYLPPEERLLEDPR